VEPQLLEPLERKIAMAFLLVEMVAQEVPAMVLLETLEHILVAEVVALGYLQQS
jgi:hypothetical protein